MSKTALLITLQALNIKTTCPNKVLGGSKKFPRCYMHQKSKFSKKPKTSDMKQLSRRWELRPRAGQRGVGVLWRCLQQMPSQHQQGMGCCCPNIHISPQNQTRVHSNTQPYTLYCTTITSKHVYWVFGLIQYMVPEIGLSGSCHIDLTTVTTACISTQQSH